MRVVAETPPSWLATIPIRRVLGNSPAAFNGQRPARWPRSDNGKPLLPELRGDRSPRSRSLTGESDAQREGDELHSHARAPRSADAGPVSARTFDEPDGYAEVRPRGASPRIMRWESMTRGRSTQTPTHNLGRARPGAAVRPALRSLGPSHDHPREPARRAKVARASGSWAPKAATSSRRSSRASAGRRQPPDEGVRRDSVCSQGSLGDGRRHLPRWPSAAANGVAGTGFRREQQRGARAGSDQAHAGWLLPPPRGGATRGALDGAGRAVRLTARRSRLRAGSC